MRTELIFFTLSTHVLSFSFTWNGTGKLQNQTVEILQNMKSSAEALVERTCTKYTLSVKVDLHNYFSNSFVFPEISACAHKQSCTLMSPCMFIVYNHSETQQMHVLPHTCRCVCLSSHSNPLSMVLCVSRYRPRTYCLADSDEESSSAGSSDEEDSSDLTNDSAGAEG